MSMEERGKEEVDCGDGVDWERRCARRSPEGPAPIMAMRRL